MSTSGVRYALPSGASFDADRVYEHVRGTKGSINDLIMAFDVDSRKCQDLIQRIFKLKTGVNTKAYDTEYTAKTNDQLVKIQVQITTHLMTLSNYFVQFKHVEWLCNLRGLASRHRNKDFLNLLSYITRESHRHPGAKYNDSHFRKIIEVLGRWKQLGPKTAHGSGEIKAPLDDCEQRVGEIELGILESDALLGQRKNADEVEKGQKAVDEGADANWVVVEKVPVEILVEEADGNIDDWELAD